MKKLLGKISLLGIRLTDDDNARLRKQFLVYQGLSMSLGGILWGVLLLAFNYPIPSVIPFGYVLITLINFYFFSVAKNFVIVRNVQTTVSLLLPFLLQMLLGGYAVSGGVMLWSILALISSVTYQDTKSSLFWLLAFIVLTLLALAFDSYFYKHFNMGVSISVSLVFLVVNIVSVAAIVFALVLYFSTMNATNMEKVKQTYIKLINAEKLAALGQVSACVAHEVNTPLDAIKSSAEESAIAYDEIIHKLPRQLASMAEEDRAIFLNFLTTTLPNKESFSTREEREIKRNLKEQLDELEVTNARFIADRLVQVGVFEVNSEMKELAKLPDFEPLIMLTYNLFNQRRNNETIKLAVDKASRIVSALKSYLHTTGSETPEPTNVNESVETVLTIYHNRLKQGIEVIKEFEPVPQVLAFSDQLSQIWTNLIVNAVQAMENKGTLTISIKQEDNYVIVSITDTGKGIPLNIQKKIFDPFFTTKVSGEGSGLGLDIIKRILDDHSGKISFTSVVGTGTTFTVKLPIKSKA